ncbi:MAG: spondin domain-containing protein [Planctomycetota bacterium]|jgi:hypothetical protein
MLRPRLHAAVCALALAGTAAAQNTPESAEARYRVTFDATWSSLTHPNAYPASAHFSPLIGATHDDSISLWGPGALATPGIEQMAETGATSLLTGEVNALIGTGAAGQIIAGSGIGISPGLAIANLVVDQDHPLVSLVSMIAPSPDWFVGVHDLSLLENGQWIDVLEVPLLAYDSGTDSGLQFTSANADTQPAEPISLVTGGPFTGATPLGTFRFERLAGAVVFGPNPPNSLVHEDGLPFLGQGVDVRFDDPTGSFPDGSLVLAGLSGLAQPNLFGGVPLPGFGLQPGTDGALLVQTPFDYLSAPNLTAAGSSLTLNVPNTPVIAGATFYVQGVLIDPVTLRAGLTQGLQLTLSN